MRTFFDTPAFAAGFGLGWLTRDTTGRVINGSAGLVRPLDAKVALPKDKL